VVVACVEQMVLEVLVLETQALHVVQQRVLYRASHFANGASCHLDVLANCYRADLYYA
jgi:hypothetical protein